MKFIQNNTKKLIWIPLLLAVFACKDDPERHLQLGSWYIQKGLLDEAILEFREATRLLPTSYKDMTREQFQILSKAHYNLALVYTKKGWWDYALKEAETCFNFQPTKKYYDLVQLIKKREKLKSAEAGS